MIKITISNGENEITRSYTTSPQTVSDMDWQEVVEEMVGVLQDNEEAPNDQEPDRLDEDGIASFE
jgi:hypothetical protein